MLINFNDYGAGSGSCGVSNSCGNIYHDVNPGSRRDSSRSIQVSGGCSSSSNSSYSGCGVSSYCGGCGVSSYCGGCGVSIGC